MGGYVLRKPNVRREMTILNSLIVPKNLKGGTLWDFQTSIMFQIIKKNERGTLWYNQKIFEKSVIVPKKNPS